MIDFIMQIIFISFGGMCMMIIVWFPIKNKQLWDKKYKNPLRKDIERLPGHSLQKKIQDIKDELSINFISIPFFYLTFLITYKINTVAELIDITKNYTMLICFGVFSIGQIFRINGIYKKMNKYKLGYECEVIVGQDLTQLKQWGYYILHDFQAKNYNIDHVIIGASGVYIIETKGRSKLKGKQEAHKLYYNGKQLKFPSHTETKPIYQANANAKSLEKWIYENTQMKYHVQSILAFPGWYHIREKNTAPNAPLIFSGKSIDWIVKRKTILNEREIKRLYCLIRVRCLTYIEENNSIIP